jgi:hypothetical protein
MRCSGIETMVGAMAETCEQTVRHMLDPIHHEEPLEDLELSEGEEDDEEVEATSASCEND